MSGVKPSAIAAQRPLLAELMGTALLVTVVVGSGIAAAIRFFFPDASVTAGRAVVPHPNHVPEEG
jgi:glycerol uptake facilitator-like aquaporin